MNKITFPIGYYPISTKLGVVAGGSIYIGEPDTDPTIVINQKTVYALQESGATVAVSQPITISPGGLPLYNGSPVSLYVTGDYSMTVLDSLGSQKYHIPNNLPVAGSESFFFDTVADMTVEPSTVGNIYYTKGYYAIGDGGQGKYLSVTSASYGAIPDGLVDHYDSLGNVLVLQSSGAINVKQAGAKGDGLTDDTAAFSAAGADSVKLVIIPGGSYVLNSVPTYSGTVTWVVLRGASFTGTGALPYSNTSKIVSYGNYDGLESDSTYHEGIFAYLESNAALTAYGNLGLHGSVKSSWRTSTGLTGADIGVSGFASNDLSGHLGGVWALYGTAVRESGAHNAHACELDIANMGSIVQLFPGDMFGAGQTHALWLGSGGEITETADDPGTASAAIGIISNDPEYIANFDKGIVFHNKAISGADGTGSEGIAIAMASGHSTTWYNNSNQKSGKFICTNTTFANSQSIDLSPSGFQVRALSDGSTALLVPPVASAVNRINITAGTVGVAPIILATGADTDVDLHLDVKGAGAIQIGYNFGIASVPANFAANRYLKLKDQSGTSFYIPAMTVTW